MSRSASVRSWSRIFGAANLVDLGGVLDLVGEVEPLEEKPILVHPDRDRGRLATPGERADRHPVGSSAASSIPC